MGLICDAHADDEADGDSDDDLKDRFELLLTRLVVNGKNFCQPLEQSDYWMDRHKSLFIISPLRNIQQAKAMSIV